VNLYFLVEGDRTEKKLYRHWIRHALPHLSEVGLVADLIGDRFYIISGGGYPSYVDRIHDSLLDLKDQPAVEHFFICIDSEELSYAAKLAEISDELARAERATRVRDCNPYFRSHVIVQHCCAETWFLGNRSMMTRHPSSPKLRSFQRFFDVRTDDPENMGCLPGYTTRASFHEQYLKAMLLEKNPQLHYTKRNPGDVLQLHYFDALRERCAAGDLASLRVLLDTWHALTPPEISP
jgi:hypothetical protein